VHQVGLNVYVISVFMTCETFAGITIYPSPTLTKLD